MTLPKNPKEIAKFRELCRKRSIERNAAKNIIDWNNSMKKGKTKIDITGQVFNMLTAIRFIEIKHGHAFWLFRCKCGKEKILDASHVKEHATKSCGCSKGLQIAKVQFIHGMSNNSSNKNKMYLKFYRTWGGMKQRCENKHNASYCTYGGKGIKVCDNWHDFLNFKKDMFESFKKHYIEHGESTSIDRFDNNDDYKLLNCKWSTLSEQSLNRGPGGRYKYDSDRRP